MAITKPKPLDAWYDYSPSETFDYEEITLAIGGKGIKVYTSVSTLDMIDMRNDQALINKLKHDMALELANHMMKDKLLEFTEFYDNISQRYKISARCYLAPDDQVKLLRVNKVI